MWRISRAFRTDGLCRRQAMFSNKAWQRHGCYSLGSDQYFNMPLGKSMIGCQDDWNSLDHFDPTTDSRRIFSHFLALRKQFSSLQDGFNLVQRGNWTYYISRPGSNNTQTEMGLWSVSRAPLDDVQTLTGNKDQIWLLYSNENQTKTWTYDCKGSLWISSPYESGQVVRNLFYPYETYTLAESGSAVNNDSKAPWFGCMSSITMDPFGFKALIPIDEWVPQPPMLTKFTPGHDARIQAEAGDANATTVQISLEFSLPMDCNSVTNGMSFTLVGNGSAPTIDQTSIKCLTLTNVDPPRIPGTPVSQWSWTANLVNFPDGILDIQVKNAATQAGVSTNVSGSS